MSSFHDKAREDAGLVVLSLLRETVLPSLDEEEAPVSVHHGCGA